MGTNPTNDRQAASWLEWYAERMGAVLAGLASLAAYAGWAGYGSLAEVIPVALVGWVLSFALGFWAFRNRSAPARRTVLHTVRYALAGLAVSVVVLWILDR